MTFRRARQAPRHTDRRGRLPAFSCLPPTGGPPRKTERPQRLHQRDHPIKHHVAGPGANPRVADRSKAGRPRAHDPSPRQPCARTTDPTSSSSRQPRTSRLTCGPCTSKEKPELRLERQLGSWAWVNAEVALMAELPSCLLAASKHYVMAKLCLVAKGIVGLRGWIEESARPLRRPRTSGDGRKGRTTSSGGVPVVVAVSRFSRDETEAGRSAASAGTSSTGLLRSARCVTALGAGRAVTASGIKGERASEGTRVPRRGLRCRGTSVRFGYWRWNVKLCSKPAESVALATTYP